jgi:hypothetical protein
MVYNNYAEQFTQLYLNIAYIGIQISDIYHELVCDKT